MKFIPTIPTNHYKAWRTIEVIFGSLLLVASVMGMLFFNQKGLTSVQLYNSFKSFLLGLFLVIPYTKISGNYKNQLAYFILALFTFQVITGSIPSAIQRLDYAGILGALWTGATFLANGLIAYQIMVKGILPSK